MTPMEGIMTLTSSGMGAGTVVSVFVAGPTGLPELSDTTVVVRPARILLGAGKSSFTMTSRKTRIILGVYISRKIGLVNSAHWPLVHNNFLIITGLSKRSIFFTRRTPARRNRKHVFGRSLFADGQTGFPTRPQVSRNRKRTFPHPLTPKLPRQLVSRVGVR